MKLAELAKLANGMPNDSDLYPDGSMARATAQEIKRSESMSISERISLLERIIIQQSWTNAALAQAYANLRDIILQADVG